MLPQDIGDICSISSQASRIFHMRISEDKYSIMEVFKEVVGVGRSGGGSSTGEPLSVVLSRYQRSRGRNDRYNLWLGRGSPTSQATEASQATPYCLVQTNHRSIEERLEIHAFVVTLNSRMRLWCQHKKCFLYIAVKIHEYLGSQTDGGDRLRDTVITFKFAANSVG